MACLIEQYVESIASDASNGTFSILTSIIENIRYHKYRKLYRVNVLMNDIVNSGRNVISYN